MHLQAWNLPESALQKKIMVTLEIVKLNAAGAGLPERVQKIPVALEKDLLPPDEKIEDIAREHERVAWLRRFAHQREKRAIERIVRSVDVEIGNHQESHVRWE